MKIGIVTFHFVNNYGGALQAYALQHCIEKECETETKIVDYRNWFIRFTDTVRLLPITTNFKEIFSGLLTMKERIGRVKKFKIFLKKNYNLTKKYATINTLQAEPPECDKYIFGSDQIWNPMITAGVDKVYFGGFETKKCKVAYAPSFGSLKMSDKQKKKIKKYLDYFKRISVREKEGSDWVKDLTGKEAVRLIDPTFLITKEEWSKVAAPPIKKGKYILLYIMQRDEKVYEYGRKLKEELGLPVVEISRYGFKHDFIDDCLVDIGPAEFLGLFEHAECICTNSYHGLVFSVIFNKKLCLVPCRRFGARISNILELLQGELDENLLVKFPPKEVLQEIVLKEREKSFQYLKCSINEDE